MVLFAHKDYSIYTLKLLNKGQNRCQQTGDAAADLAEQARMSHFIQQDLIG